MIIILYFLKETTRLTGSNTSESFVKDKIFTHYERYSAKNYRSTNRFVLALELRNMKNYLYDVCCNLLPQHKVCLNSYEVLKEIGQTVSYRGMSLKYIVPF